MPKQASLAAYYREHREAFALALELGCTPAEAKQKLRDQARARRRACGTRAPEACTDSDFEPMDQAPGDFRAWDCRHMMRD
ncbi:hypothetical protein [Novosphingobium naphthalenivorans]|uniref:hypothetical protein n=1 Tax=Novosphingobium naphthalenivorans TaxID=273168 RepID=UPI0008309384|nr:hypothetical protein [Novosphingobium naphthalenivorans]